MPKHAANNGITLKPKTLLGADPSTSHIAHDGRLRKNPHDLRMRRGGNGGLSMNAILDVTSHSQDVTSHSQYGLARPRSSLTIFAGRTNR
jgi:hypothetical protein